MGPDVLRNYIRKIGPSQKLTADGAVFSAVRQILVAFTGKQQERLQPVDCILIAHPIWPVRRCHLGRLRVEILLFQPAHAGFVRMADSDRGSVYSGPSAIGQSLPSDCGGLLVAGMGGSGHWYSEGDSIRFGRCSLLCRCREGCPHSGKPLASGHSSSATYPSRPIHCSATASHSGLPLIYLSVWRPLCRHRRVRGGLGKDVP